MRPGDPVLTTRDPGEARRVVSDVYIPVDLTVPGGRAVDFRLRYLASRQLTVGHLAYGADTELHVPPMRDCYHLNLTLQGRTTATQRGRTVSTRSHGSGVVFDPRDAFRDRWSADAVQYAVKLPARAVATHLGRLLGRPVDRPVTFALGVDLTSPAGQALLSTVRFLRRELARPGGLATVPVAREQLESLVLTQVLLTVPHDHTDLLRATGTPAPPADVRRAVDLVHEQPDRDLTVAALAAAAGTSARSLQRGFQDLVGMSPTAYVRAVRLDRVHAELLVGEGTASVTEVAVRWGFSHLGRFARQYRDRFGVLPSRTARGR